MSNMHCSFIISMLNVFNFEHRISPMENYAGNLLKRDFFNEKYDVLYAYKLIYQNKKQINTCR